jgi:hypothetical protein
VNCDQLDASRLSKKADGKISLGERQAFEVVTNLLIEHAVCSRNFIRETIRHRSQDALILDNRLNTVTDEMFERVMEEATLSIGPEFVCRKAVHLDPDFEGVS